MGGVAEFDTRAGRRARSRSGPVPAAPGPGPAGWRRRVGGVVVALALAALVTACVAFVHSRPGGVDLERDGMHSLYGTSRSLDTIAAWVRWVPRVSVVVAALTVVSVLVRHAPRRSVAAFVVLAGSNVCAQGAKSVLERVLDPAGATLPSGHATLALSSGVALVLLAPPRLRHEAVLVASAWGTLGCVGVVAAYWHSLGDVICAVAIVAAWTSVARLLLAPTPGSRTWPGWWVHPARQHLFLAACGAAWFDVVIMGWGSGVSRLSLGRTAAALILIIAIPAAVAWIVAAAARAVPGSAGPTH